MPLVDPDVAIAFLKAQSKRDLAIVALVASMADSEQEAIDRLGAIGEVVGDYKKTLDRRCTPRTELAIVDGVCEMAPRIAEMIQQMLNRAEEKKATA